MPSPIGHAMAGVIVALAGEEPPARRPWPLLIACAALAAIPDLDYIYPPIHRGPTHSFAAVLLVAVGVAAVTRSRGGRTHWRVVAVCTMAYASHLFMDWLGRDVTDLPGVRMLWPWSDHRLISGWDVFRNTERTDLFTYEKIVHNARTLLQEVVILGPILAVLWWRRRTR